MDLDAWRGVVVGEAGAWVVVSINHSVWEVAVLLEGALHEETCYDKRYRGGARMSHRRTELEG